MRRRCLAGVVTVVLAVSACSAGTPKRRVRSTPTDQQASTPAPTTPAPTTPTTSAHISAPPSPPGLARSVRDHMSEEERVGQLLMVDCPSTGPTSDTLAAVENYHVGSLILDGTSQLGTEQTAAIVADLQQRAPADAKLFIATDQEGGRVQRLQGPGFSDIPSALEQGGLEPVTLRADAQLWGAELRAAGVNLDLGPVLDTVPRGAGPNPPIGDLDREYGHDPATVTTHGIAVAQGLRAAGVEATVKHFPGLGRVRGNTDLSRGVLDRVTTRHDPYLAPFAAAIRDGVAFVMMSTAIYPLIDLNLPAAFSPTIVRGMLRGDLRFRGVIISDDVGISMQVSGYSVGQRAVMFIAAGGDLILTVDPAQTQVMTAALLARVKTDRVFRAQVDAAALVVLQAKQARGLLH